MAWEVVKLDNKKIVRKSAKASVGRGRISFNATACDLLDDYEQFKYAEFLVDSTKPGKVAIQLYKDNTENAIKITPKIVEGKRIKNIEVSSKDMMEKLFGKTGIQKGFSQFNVTKETPSMLIVNTKE